MFSALHSPFSMPLTVSISISDLNNNHHRVSHPKSKFIVSASLDSELNLEIHKDQSCYEETKQRIKKLFDKVELSVSAYDTAWVAMVPSPTSSEVPCFPQCLNWLLDNQHKDGSWGINPYEPTLGKDMLSSTLASILSLKKWGVGEEHMKKGLSYIQTKIEYAMDAKHVSPVGFEIVFPSMIESARDLNLDLAVKADLCPLFQKRDLELKRITGSNSPGSKAYMAYISEGMKEFIDQETVMEYQRKNGSLFNSPSTTAAVLTRQFDSNCLSYLQSVLDQSRNGVPTVYPLDIFARLCMVDALARTGIDHHFTTEIQNVLDTTFRCWEQEEEEILLDVATCAIAFRLLRVNGYKVSPGPLAQFSTEEQYLRSLSGHLNDMNAVLELHRASEVITHRDESVLKKINAWSCPFLKRNCCDDAFHSDNLKLRIRQEVDDVLKFPSYVSLERLENRRYIDICGSGTTKVLKTAYNCTNIGSKDILKLAAEDFNCNQPYLREEFSYFERWVSENRLGKLQFARQAVWHCYFSAAAVFVTPGLSNTRLEWAKSALLTTIMDDFFDVKGSKEELENFIHLVEKWDLNLAAISSCSEEVGILFLAIHRVVTELAVRAKKLQGRDVTGELADVWLKGSRAMSKEAEWQRNGYLPIVDEYITNGYVSVVTNPTVQAAVYFVGPMISEEVVNGAEFLNLCETTGIIGRLLNDIASFKREFEQGKLNAIALHMAHDPDITKERVILEMKEIIECKRMELLQLVLQQNTEVPNACKQVFWKMCKNLHMCYPDEDLVDSIKILNLADSFLHEPVLQPQLPSAIS